MKYLDNPICTFTILSDYDRNKKYDILSTCFFLMDNGYKNLNIYIDGLKKIILLLNSQDKYVGRIFIDENVKNHKEIYGILISSSKVQIILFKCGDFMKNNYHFDAFGALVRLFPLFDFDNNDANNVIIIDIDLNDEDIVKLEKLMIFSLNPNEPIDKTNLITGTVLVYDLLIRRISPHYYCGLFTSYTHKFDKNIILNFIKSAHKISDPGRYDKRLTPFGYGTDEIFLNKYLIYSKDNHHDLSIIFQYDINWFLYNYKKDITKEKPNQTYQNLRFILGKYYKGTMRTKDMFEKIDNLTYKKKSSDEQKIYVSNRFYELIDRLGEKNEEWFSLRDIKFIKKYLYGIIDCISIIFYNRKTLEITGVKILSKNIFNI
jgi:hypothetical protein